MRFLAALLNRPKPETMSAVTMLPARGMVYVCRRCDVYGSVAAGEAAVCWSCEQGDRLERR